MVIQYDMKIETYTLYILDRFTVEIAGRAHLVK
jgi:hypothetical protein